MCTTRQATTIIAKLMLLQRRKRLELAKRCGHTTTAVSQSAASDYFIYSRNPPRPTMNLCCCVALQRHTLSIKSLGHGSSARLVGLRVVVYTRNSRGIRLDGVLLPGVKTKACKSSCTFLIRLLHGEENLIRMQVQIQSLFKGTRRR